MTLFHQSISGHSCSNALDGCACRGQSFGLGIERAERRNLGFALVQPACWTHSWIHHSFRFALRRCGCFGDGLVLARNWGGGAVCIGELFRTWPGRDLLGSPFRSPKASLQDRGFQALCHHCFSLPGVCAHRLGRPTFGRFRKCLDRDQSRLGKSDVGKSFSEFSRALRCATPWESKSWRR